MSLFLCASVLLMGDVALAEVCASDISTSMLQFTMALKDNPECGRLIQDECDLHANFPCSNNCPIHTHGKDCYRPVPEVMAEHPDVDGYCYFNATSFWVAYTGPSVSMADAAADAIGNLQSFGYRGLNGGQLVTYKFEGQMITTYLDADHYLYDDLYGYSLGFLQGQGLNSSWMQDSALWTKTSEQKCNEIQNLYHFTKDELVLADWLDFNQVISVMTACSAGMVAPGSSDQSVLDMANWRSSEDCQPVTRKDFAKHHYVKCLLGYRNSAQDMAYLNLRACLSDSHIGHLDQCPFSPDLRPPTA